MIALYSNPQMMICDSLVGTPGPVINTLYFFFSSFLPQFKWQGSLSVNLKIGVSSFYTPSGKETALEEVSFFP